MTWRQINLRNPVTFDVRDGSNEPFLIDTITRRVVGRNYRRQEGHEVVLVVIRHRDRDNRQVLKTVYYLSMATVEAEFARVAKAERRIAECIRRAKSEAGLADKDAKHRFESGMNANNN